MPDTADLTARIERRILDELRAQKIVTSSFQSLVPPLNWTAIAARQNIINSLAQVIERECGGCDPRDCTQFVAALMAVLTELRWLPKEVFDSIGVKYSSPISTSPSISHDARVYWRAIIDELLGA